MSEVKVNKISPRSGTDVTLGDASDTFTLPSSAEIDIASGATLDVNGTIDVTGSTVTGLSATDISSGTLGTARLGTGSASSSTFLRGDQSWAAAGGNNTPAFHAYMTSYVQAWSSGSWTLVPNALETFDTDGEYDTTAYRFTPTTAGKYWFYGQVTASSNNGTLSSAGCAIYKNGAEVVTNRWEGRAGVLSGDVQYRFVGLIEDMDGSSDYVELWGYMATAAGARVDLAGYDTRVFFGGFRLL